MQSSCREGQRGVYREMGLVMDKENAALILCFPCLPTFNRNFLRAVVCTPLCSFYWRKAYRAGVGRVGGGAVLTRTANYSLSCLHACLRFGRRIAEAGNDAVRLSSPAPQKSCPFAACRMTD